MATARSTDRAEVPPLLFSRQPVLDAGDQVVGYRISYALVSEGLPVMPTADEVFAITDDLLSVIDHDEQALNNKAHLALPPEMLLCGEVPQIPPEQVVLRISYEDAITQPLTAVVQRAASDGFELELDGLPGPDVDLGLLDYFSTVEIDLGCWDLDQAAGFLSRIKPSKALRLATGVANHRARDQARRLGFDRFVGPFFATPNITSGEPISARELRAIVELCRIKHDGASPEQLVALIEDEVGLAIRLLRQVNSPYFGFAGSVRTIEQAAAMLGPRTLARWALIVAVLTSLKPVSRELALIALTRARACELVGLGCGEKLHGGKLFLTGLLSISDALLGTPIDQIMRALPLADQVRVAILDRRGPGGEVLQSVIAYEQGEFRSPALRAALSANAAAYPEALDWARRAVHGMV